jgi:mRNA interferase MazF
VCETGPGLREGTGGRGAVGGRSNMARILRGEIRWADLNPTRGREQAGRRPVLILSNDVFNERSGTVIAVALTSQPQRAGFPLTLELSAPGLPARSWVKISQIRTLAVERIGQQLAHATAEEMLRVIEGLNEIIGT